MKIYVILSGGSEDYSEYGSLVTDVFEAAVVMEDSAKLMISGLAEEFRQSHESSMYKYAEVPKGDPIIPENAVYLVGDHESVWYYYKEYEMSNTIPPLQKE